MRLCLVAACEAVRPPAAAQQERFTMTTDADVALRADAAHGEIAIAQLEAQADEIEPSVPMAQVAEALERLEFLKEVVRNLQQRLEPRVIEWIRNNGDIEYGHLRYYVGAKKRTRCIDTCGTL